MDNFSFNPENGFKDTTTYPNPASGTQARNQLMTLHEQLRDFINNTVVAGINALTQTVSGKQDALTFDDSPTENSNNPVKSGGIYTALNGKQGTLTFDGQPTDNSNNPVTSNGIYDALAQKQSVLAYDATPTQDSTRMVRSGGIWTTINDLSTSFKTSELKLVVSGTTYVISVDGQGNLTATPEV